MTIYALLGSNVSILFDAWQDAGVTATDRAAVEVGECCAPGGLALAQDAAEALAQRFKALGDPTRVHLLAIVSAAEGGEACVCDLTAPVGLSQPTVSHHLKILVDAGLLAREKRGVWSYYSLVPGALARLAADVNLAPHKNEK